MTARNTFFTRRDAAALREWKLVVPLDLEMHTRIWDVTPELRRTVPLVLVPGLGMSSRYWVRLGQRLADEFFVLAPDMPGFGRSPKPPAAPWPGGPDVREQADQLLAWMDAHAIERAILCGHSTGGETVADVAARFPHRVEKLILSAPTFEQGHRTLLAYIPRLALGALVEMPTLCLLMVLDYSAAGLARVLQQATRMIDDPIERKLPLVKAPTLVIAGEWDTCVSRRWVEKVTSLVPRAALVVVERVGHAIHYSSPNAMAKVIGDFITGKLDVTNAPVHNTILASEDDPRRDRLGPPQPISPGAHGVMDYLLAAAALMLPRRMGWGTRTQQLWTGAAMLSAMNNLLTDHPVAVRRRFPMVVHANVDVMTGTSLLFAAATVLRGEKRSARWATAALGCYQILLAALTAKPTGPARVCSVRKTSDQRVDSMGGRQQARGTGGC